MRAQSDIFKISYRNIKSAYYYEHISTQQSAQRERERKMDKLDIRELAAETGIEATLQAEWDLEDAQLKSENSDISDFLNARFIISGIKY